MEEFAVDNEDFELRLQDDRKSLASTATGTCMNASGHQSCTSSSSKCDTELDESIMLLHVSDDQLDCLPHPQVTDNDNQRLAEHDDASPQVEGCQEASGEKTEFSQEEATFSPSPASNKTWHQIADDDGDTLGLGSSAEVDEITVPTAVGVTELASSSLPDHIIPSLAFESSHLSSRHTVSDLDISTSRSSSTLPGGSLLERADSTASVNLSVASSVVSNHSSRVQKQHNRRSSSSQVQNHRLNHEDGRSHSSKGRKGDSAWGMSSISPPSSPTKNQDDQVIVTESQRSSCEIDGSSTGSGDRGHKGRRRSMAGSKSRARAGSMSTTDSGLDAQSIDSTASVLVLLSTEQPTKSLSLLSSSSSSSNMMEDSIMLTQSLSVPPPQSPQRTATSAMIKPSAVVLSASADSIPVTDGGGCSRNNGSANRSLERESPHTQQQHLDSIRSMLEESLQEERGLIERQMELLIEQVKLKRKVEDYELERCLAKLSLKKDRVDRFLHVHQT